MANINGTKNDDILVDAGNGIDAFNGKGGIDTLVSEFTWSDKAVFNLLEGEMVFNGNTYDTFKNIENLTLGGGADVIGDAKDNVFKFVDVGGNFHNNEVHAGGGDDKVFGGIGNDIIYGNAGNDVLKGGQGSDALYGGTGDDVLKGGSGYDVLNGGDGADTLKGGGSGDILNGGDGDDILDGGDGNDILHGSNGNDLVKGGAGDDRLYGGAGSDVMKGNDDGDELYGGNGADTLKGGTGNDRLEGENGEDILKAGQGNDILIGGAGDDVLRGGQGIDEFRFSANDGSDVIEDFVDGVDHIYLADFNFANAAEALSHFVERGSASNDVVGFEYDGTTIKIKGLDLADIDASDLII